VFAAAPEAYVAMVVLTRLHLFTLEQVAGRDVKPARTRLHQLIAGDREAIHVAAAANGYQECASAGMADVWLTTVPTLGTAGVTMFCVKF
jgi:hypothetical protein